VSDRWAVTSLILLVGIAPLAYLPGAAEGSMLLKAAVVTAGIAACVMARPVGTLPRAVAALGAAGIVWLTLCAAASETPWSSLVGRYPRYEGIPMLAVYGAAAWAGSRLLTAASPARQRLTTTVLALGALTATSVAVIERMNGTTRPGSLLTNAAELGAYSALCLGVLLVAALRDRSGWSVAGTIAATIGIVLSGSRGALLGAAVVVVVVAIGEGRRVRSWRRAVVGGAAGLALLGAMAALVPSLRSRVSGDSDLAAATVVGRRLLWETAADLVAGSPWLGVGPSGFTDAIGRFQSPAWAAAVGPANPPDSPHQVMLQAAAAGGIVLVAIAAAVVVVSGYYAVITLRSRSMWPWALAASVGAYAVCLQVEFTHPANTPLALVLLGALVGRPAAAIPPPTRTKGAESNGSSVPAPAKRTRVLAAAVAIVGVAVVVSAMAEYAFETALTRLEAGDVAGASAAFSTASSLRPWDRDLELRTAYAMTAGATSGLVPPSAAVPRAEVAVERFPTSTEAHLTLAGAYEAAGDLAAAEAALADAAKLSPWNPDLPLRRGIVAAELGDDRAAEEFFQSAAAMAPSAPAPWENLARLYTLTGRDDDAELALVEADRRLKN
jgi:Flp pilus assembly protein TadD/O-antigen ligase